MDLKEQTIEDLLPHRDRMLLIDKIVDVDDSSAVSKAVISKHWPLTNGVSVSSIIMIELTAQTAGINNSLQRIQRRGKQDGNMGWIAGVKSAIFHVDDIPIGSTLITSTRNSFCYEDFSEIIGTVTLDTRILGEITLQLMAA